MPVAMTDNSNKSTNPIDPVTKISANWTKSHAVFPLVSCEGHAACSIGNHLFVFGGAIQCEGMEVQELSDLYKLDVNKQIWLEVETKGEKPAARCNATMSAVGTKLYLFGGLCHSSGWLNDLYSFDTETSCWSQIKATGTGPTPRDKLSSATVGDKIYFFGGFGPKSNGLEDINEEEWSDEEGEGDITGDQEAAQFGWFNELFVFDTITCSWNQPLQMNLGVPTQRAAHTLSCVNGRDLVVFGGRDMEARCNDLNIYNTETRKWNTNLEIKGTSPQPRSFHSATTVGRSVVVIGGRGVENQHYGDCHVFDTEASRWSELFISGDSPASRGVHTCHLVGDKLVLFGGSADFSNDLMQCQTFFTDTFFLSIPELLPSSPVKKAPST